MRLVDLQVGADRGIHLELHPKLTVVVAGTRAQERLASLLGRAYVLAGTEVTGTVDGGGYLTPFDPTAVVALDLVGDGLAAIGPADLPPPDVAPRQAALAEIAAHQAQLRGRLTTVAADRDHLARLHEATLAALTAGSEEREDSIARSADLAAAMAAVRARPAELAVEREAARAGAEVASTRLAELRAAGAEAATVLGPGADGSTYRLGDDTDPLVAVLERLAALGGLRPDEQREIVGWTTDVADGTAPVRSSAQELIEQVRSVEEAWQEAARRGIEGDPEVARLAGERSDLSTNHELLVGLSRSGMLGETAKAQIDGAHIAVVQATKSTAAAASAGEQEVLARYGFDSYLEFTIATSTRSVGQAIEAKLAELTERVETLDAQLVEARNAAAARLEQLADAREPAQERVTAFLGHRPEGSSIDALSLVPEVPAAVLRLTVSVDEAVEAAQDEVVRSNDLVQELDDEERSLDDRVAELTEQQAVVDSRVADLDEVLGKASHESDVLADRLAMTDTSVAEITAAVSSSTDEIARIDATPNTYGRHDVASAVESVVGRLDPWSESPRPVLLADTFAPFPADEALQALAALVARAERNQIIYLTSSSVVRGWAEELDPSVGRLVVVSEGRWSPRRLGRRVLGRGTS